MTDDKLFLTALNLFAFAALLLAISFCIMVFLDHEYDMKALDSGVYSVNCKEDGMSRCIYLKAEK